MDRRSDGRVVRQVDIGDFGRPILGQGEVHDGDHGDREDQYGDVDAESGFDHVRVLQALRLLTCVGRNRDIETIVWRQLRCSPGNMRYGYWKLNRRCLKSAPGRTACDRGALN
ncbi:hypothetical protein D9M72_452840 [compost metagenome]